MMGANRGLEKNRDVNYNYSNHPNPTSTSTYPVAATSSGYYIESSERQWTSWLVPMIVVANIAIFLIVMFVNNCPKNNFRFDNCVARFLGRFSFQPLKENPLVGPSSDTLLLLGALRWENVVFQHQGWRLITCIWLHAGLIHITLNLLSLVVIGIRLEQQFGFVRIGILYLLSGLGGSVLAALFLQRNVSVGASGCLFGLLGAMLSELLTNWTIYENKAAALFTLLIMITLNLALGILPHVDNFAHIGGFLSGFLLGFVLLLRPRYAWLVRRQMPEHGRVKSKYMAYQMVLFFLAAVLLAAGFTVALVMLFQGKNGNDHCRWCRYLSCVPTSKWNCES